MSIVNIKKIVFHIIDCSGFYEGALNNLYYKTKFYAGIVCLNEINSKTSEWIFIWFSPIDRTINDEGLGVYNLVVCVD